MDLWAKKKGINIVATGDFTHPAYLKELKEKLAEDGSGLFKLTGTRDEQRATRFLLSGEISCIYKDKEKTRRLHILVLAPNFAAVDKINSALEKRKCNLRSDGRPIIGLSAKELARICFEANEKTMVIPAHAWTPWFSVFGSKSGYDSLRECFEELTPNIFAIETGLSSDPGMNWRLSALDKITLISNSDAHSPINLGREANVFDLSAISYNEIYDILRQRDAKKFLYTIEFFPQEGKYHFDGHSDCKFVCAPAESKRQKNICPKCKKGLVLGVEHRVDDLADNPIGRRPQIAIPYKSVVPLLEILAECAGVAKTSKKVLGQYEELLKKRNEFEILLDMTLSEISALAGDLAAEAIERVRKGNVQIAPGYDGVFGTVKIFSDEEREKHQPNQKVLF